MALVNREAPHEPDERPTELGRHIWTVCHENPGQFRVVFETDKRERATHIEGCLIGRGAGRIAPILDLTGWDARMVEVPSANGDGSLYEVRVRYTPPRGAKTIVHDSAAQLLLPEPVQESSASGGVATIDRR